MITITFDRKELSMIAKGHARAVRNEYGHDLVCCATSTLMQAYAYAGMRSGHIMELQMDKGDMIARVDPDTTPSQAMQHIYDGYVMGLRMLAESYPEHVRLIE